MKSMIASGDIETQSIEARLALAATNGVDTVKANRLFQSFYLFSDVLVDSDLILSMESNDGMIARLWSGPTTNSTLLLTTGQTVTNGISVVNGQVVNFATHGEVSEVWLQVLAPGTGSISYGFAGTNNAAGISFTDRQHRRHWRYRWNRRHRRHGRHRRNRRRLRRSHPERRADRRGRHPRRHDTYALSMSPPPTNNQFFDFDRTKVKREKMEEIYARTHIILDSKEMEEEAIRVAKGYLGFFGENGKRDRDKYVEFLCSLLTSPVKRIRYDAEADLVLFYLREKEPPPDLDKLLADDRVREEIKDYLRPRLRNEKPKEEQK